MKTVLVLGASPNPERYSYLAVKRLLARGHHVIAVGKRPGSIDSVVIQKDWPEVHPDTITMYLGAPNQTEYYDLILHSGARRIIFNPGAENPELAALARENGIATEEACTLVMLSTGTF
ncbi:MAG: hypothetical protein RL220_957 [Bacteroidota bacterium]|jgi:predicted CoA-binding protein